MHCRARTCCGVAIMSNSAPVMPATERAPPFKKCTTRHGVPRPAISRQARPEDFCLQNVNNLSQGCIHPVFNEKSEKK